MASKGGKGARARRKQRRDQEKRKRKAAQKALYLSRRDSGSNSKRKNRMSKKRGKVPSTVSHPLGKCGNVGCVECNGLNFRPFLTKQGEPRGMPHWMFKKYTGDPVLKPTRV